MIPESEHVTEGILTLVKAWEPRLAAFPEELISGRKNRHDRTIRQK